jgi:hypothetical protein
MAKLGFNSIFLKNHRSKLMNNLEKLKVLNLKLEAVIAKKVDFSDIPNWVDNAAQVYIICSDLWYEHYYAVVRSLREAIAFLEQLNAVDYLMALDINSI